GDGEVLLSDHRASANRQQIDCKFLGVPSFIGSREGLIVTHHSDVNRGRFTATYGFDTGDSSVAEVLDCQVILHKSAIGNGFARFGRRQSVCGIVSLELAEVPEGGATIERMLLRIGNLEQHFLRLHFAILRNECPSLLVYAAFAISYNRSFVD